MQCHHFTLGCVRWAASAAILLAIMGCAGWQADRFNPEHLRDERALELDARLSETRPSVQNPFQATQ